MAIYINECFTVSVSLNSVSLYKCFEYCVCLGNCVNCSSADCYWGLSSSIRSVQCNR